LPLRWVENHNGKFYVIASFQEQKYLLWKSLHNVSYHIPSTHLRLLLKTNAEVPMQPYSVMARWAKIITTFWASWWQHRERYVHKGCKCQ
jgi:hypothetical protein